MTLTQDELEYLFRLGERLEGHKTAAANQTPAAPNTPAEVKALDEIRALVNEVLNFCRPGDPCTEKCPLFASKTNCGPALAVLIKVVLK